MKKNKFILFFFFLFTIKTVHIETRKVCNVLQFGTHAITSNKENRKYFNYELCSTVNCDNQKGYTVCEIYGAMRVPQLKLFKGSELISTYSNDITNYNNIKSWIYYITTPLFVGVQDENELKSYETENNIFLTCSENLPADLFDVAKLYKEECYFINITNPDMCTRMNIKTNELHVMSAYNHSTYDLDTLDRELLKLFVNKNRFPLVMKIDHRNFFNIRSSGNNLMLLLLDMKKNPNAYILDILIKFKKHIKYILKKAFKTDFLSFIGFICSVIMMLLTAILVIHTIYKYYMSYTHNTYIEKEEKSE
ncbi:hypothetical protein PFBG_03452 [Plasmodium falciparum 7G8]|uniref:Uncharacterized protein n=1 Tax=Plasmodium falciparum (isolate 7G8) TaxID=57266 RepID=W7FDB7_PLAF8|nr:hypothetical protein PFBG_03452 [Plasmodium falciparum 7G8]